jgi:hypothetical protein
MDWRILVFYPEPEARGFVNKRASYSFGIISLAHAPLNVTDFFIGSINCNPNNADKGHSIIEKLFTQFTPKST